MGGLQGHVGWLLLFLWFIGVHGEITLCLPMPLDHMTGLQWFLYTAIATVVTTVLNMPSWPNKQNSLLLLVSDIVKRCHY